jgi:hypothetical protein
MSRRRATPVLVFADLPPGKMFPTPEHSSYGRPWIPAPDRERCHARSRGDTGATRAHRIPKDGGFRCLRYATGGTGLCGRHYNKATLAVRARAAALAKGVA